MGVKKCEANQKQHASRQTRSKALISVAAIDILHYDMSPQIIFFMKPSITKSTIAAVLGLGRFSIRILASK